MILKEFEFLQYKDEAKPHFIKEETFLAIEKFVLDNEERAQYLKITTKKGLGKVLQAQNYVGLIQTKDGTTIEILPKIQELSEDESKNILIKMLKTLKKSPFKNVNMAHLQSTKMPLLEIFITMFLEELAALVRKGIKSDYITKEENLPFLKGKLKVGEQIKKNNIHKERFYVQYQEFLSDRAENRLIKTTLHYLYKKSHTTKNQQRIREFLFVFDEISTCKDVKNDFLHVKPNRQMKEYKQILLWCKTFLLENAFSPYKGDDIAFALLFDMNLLFESYVGAYLKKKGLHVSLQDRGKHLVEEPRKFALKPDIVVTCKTNSEKLIIADTKWKIIKEEKDISQSDMYQLFAYGKKYANQTLYLIYPRDGTEQPKLNYCYETGLHLKVLFFDVSKNWEQSPFRV
ncbi:MAG: restriction endonuclease [Epsilonproteobacteria bacterium]|nr:restriction endonuclease [Campylobacterota bacterium]